MGTADKIGNKVEEMKGEFKQQVGKVTGDKSLENEGKKDDFKGNIKQAGEKVKDAFS